MVQIIAWLLVLPVFIGASVLRIDQGRLNGTISISRNGHKFHSFYGIPYAQPPIGRLRFQPPEQPPPSWKGTRDATKEAPYCPQMNTWFKEGYFGSEDCLFLQVFTRKIKPTKLRPVLVFFHGGAFTAGGSNQYPPDFFMDKSLVLVTVNYRLGVFGFFSTGDPSYPGNYGLKDQIVALQWIQKNIHSFGGNPSAVTIMGQASGGSSVHFLMLASASKDLFHRAILQSGVANLGWSLSTADQAKESFRNLKQYANCSRSTTKKSVACLLALPTKTLKEFEFTSRRDAIVEFKPVIDEPSQNGRAVLGVDPNDYVYPRPIKPIIIGFTSNEVLGLGESHQDAPPPTSTEKESLEDVLPNKFHYEAPDQPGLKQKITALIKELYFENDLSNFRNETSVSTLISDMTFKLPIVDSIKHYPGVEYVYEYDYSDSSSSRGRGVGHSEDLKRFFPQTPRLEANDADEAMTNALLTYWSNFVISGDPNKPDSNIPARWTPISSKNEDLLMHISNDGFMMEEKLPRDKDELWELVKKSQKPVAANSRRFN